MANNENLKPFKKGNDPRRNLKGRLPLSETNMFKELLLRHGNKEYEVRGKKIKAIDLIAERIVHDAAKGKLGAIKIFLNRTEGEKQKQAASSSQKTGVLSEAALERLAKIFPDLQ